MKARIRVLADRTVSNGCTEAEAMAAAEMVGRLLDRYALTMDEIDVRATRCVEITVPLGGQRRRPVDSCVPSIARFCDCKVWVARDKGPPSYVFFGFEADASLARYLYEIVDRAIRNGLQFYRTENLGLAGLDLRRASRDFQHGMATRVADRLDEMQIEREHAMAARRSAGTALMIVKHQVVEEAFRDTGTRLASGGWVRFDRRGAAFRQGRAAGDRVNLNRPVAGARAGRIDG
ncbi:MAG TPA: DUF2786 domain-containing protein [Roseomonas sp.]